MTWRGEGAIKKAMSITQFVSLFIPPTAHLFLFFVPDGVLKIPQQTVMKKNPSLLYHLYCQH